MELSDYLRIVRRRWWILILVPVIAGGAVGYVQLSQPATFSATATVAAPALVGGTSTNQYSGAAGPKTFVGNFIAAISTPQIVTRVSEETGIKAGPIKDGLAAAQVGTSSIMEVTYTAKKKQNAGPVANAAARATIVFLFKDQLDLAREPLDVAQQALNKAQADLDAFTKAAGTPVPDQDYNLKAASIAALEQDRAQAIAAGDTIAADRLGTLIDARKVELVQLGAVLAQFKDLQDKKVQAVTNVNQLQQTFQQANAQFKAADPDKAVLLGDTVKVDAVSKAILGGAAAAAGGLFLAIGIVALVELGSRRRKPTQESSGRSGRSKETAEAELAEAR